MINFVEAEKLKLEKSSERAFVPTLDQDSAELLGKNFFKICDEFHIDPKDQVLILGQKHLRTIQNWKKENTVGQSWDVFNRVSLLLGIVKNLNVIYPRNSDVVNSWLHKKRKIFKGKSALELITEDPLQGQAALFTVRRVLDLYRNGVIFELN
jgi:hypothetical protein